MLLEDRACEAHEGARKAPRCVRSYTQSRVRTEGALRRGGDVSVPRHLRSSARRVGKHARAMSFLGEFVGHLIRRNMEDPEERRKKRNAHLQDMDTRAQALCVDTHTHACMHGLSG